MKTEDYQMLSNFAMLVGQIAAIEAISLNVRDLLKCMPTEGRADVGDELQQVADLSRTIAEKLEVADLVQAIRHMQETRVEGDKALNDSFNEAIKAFENMGKKYSEEDGETG